MPDSNRNEIEYIRLQAVEFFPEISDKTRLEVKVISKWKNRKIYLVSDSNVKITAVVIKPLIPVIALAQLLKTHDFLNYLNTKNLSSIQLNLKKPRRFAYGRKILLLREFLDRKEISNIETAQEYGRSLAEIHIQSRQYLSSQKSSSTQKIIHFMRLLSEVLLPGRLAYITEESFFAGAAEILCSKNDQKLFPSGLIHGDIRPSNLSAKNEKAAFSDFDKSHYSFFWRDIASTAAAIYVREINGDMLKAFLRSYCSTRPLTSDEMLILPGKILFSAREHIKYDGIDTVLTFSEKVEKLKSIEEGLILIDFFELLNVEKPVFYMGFRGGHTLGILGLRFVATSIFTRMVNSLGITTMRQLKDESLIWSNKFNHPITWDPYMKGGNGGFNRRGRDDYRDAFRHCYAAAVSTYEIGEWVSRLIGDFRKIISWQKPAAVKMDIYNNRIGRKIGREIRKKYGRVKKSNLMTRIKNEIACESNKALQKNLMEILNRDEEGPK